MSEDGFSVAQKGFVPSNTARYNNWTLNFPHDVLLTDDPKLLCFCLRKYVSILLVVSNGRLIIPSDGRLE